MPIFFLWFVRLTFNGTQQLSQTADGILQKFMKVYESSSPIKHETYGVY